MKISGFTIVKNAIKFHYPIVESINSILPICDEYIVSVGKSDDKTLDLIHQIKSKKIKIIETDWDLSNGYGELTRQTNIALKACTGDWAFYLQSDEIIHEADLGRLKFLMKHYYNQPDVDALRFRWFHFFGSHYRYRIDQGWYQKQERIIRNNGTIESYHDGFGFHRKDGSRLRIKDAWCYLYHYGWTYTAQQMAQRKHNASTIWNKTEGNVFYDYGNIELFPVYFGSHPKVMKNIIAQNPLTQADKKTVLKNFWWHPSLWFSIRLKTSRRVRMKIDPLAKEPAKRIVVFRTGNIGDVLMVTPLVRKLKEKFPGCCIDFIVSPQAKMVLVANKNIDNLFVYEKFKKIHGKIKKFFLAQQLKRQQYDYAFVLETDQQYHRFMRKVAPKAVTIGYQATNGNGKKLLDVEVPFHHDWHVIDNILSLFTAQFKVTLEPKDYQMNYFISDAVKAHATQLLHQWNPAQQQYVVIHPGSSVPHVPYRGWVSANFAQLICWLNSQGYRVYITGIAKEAALVNSIYQDCKSDLTTTFIGHSFDEFALLLKHAKALVCADTGSLHMGRCFKIPVVGLFGPTNMINTGFIGEGLYASIRNDFKCGPCIASFPKDMPQCLDGKPPACMQSITVDQVKQELMRMIGS